MSGCSDKMVRSRPVFADNRGFSLTELVVVMAIFLSVMLITSNAFKLIANSSSQQSKSVETQIGGVVGLEIFRADLEQAGFGLPWTFQATPAGTGYQEAAAAPASAYNDAPNSAPRAITSGFNKTLFGTYTGSKYIVIKSTVVAVNKAAKKWKNISFTGGFKTDNPWGDPDRDFAANDKVVVVKNNLVSTPPSRQLVVSTSGALVPSGTFSAPFSTYSTLLDSHLDGDTYQIYGIAPADISAVRMPFNRADYYLSIPPDPKDLPDYCATNTGVLYKAAIRHADGARDPMPLLDCVADLQIVYGLDTDSSGRVNFHATAAPATASDQRAQIKELRVYLLVQDGKKDLTFKYPNPTIAVGESFDGGVTIAGRIFDLTTIPNYRNYRWKVYSIVVRPKNLIQ